MEILPAELLRFSFPTKCILYYSILLYYKPVDATLFLVELLGTLKLGRGTPDEDNAAESED